MTDSWNLASAWEVIADTVGDSTALIHQDASGHVELSWQEFDRRSACLASVMADAGIGRDSKVAHYMFNSHRYIETTFASHKLRAIPVNVNYRYTAAELLYLLNNSDAECIVVDDAFVDGLCALVPELRKLKLIVVVGMSAPRTCAVAMVDYETALAQAQPCPRISRDLDDLWFLYTGGTTGMPKGVMWPHRSLIGATAPTFKPYGLDAPTSLVEVAQFARIIHDRNQPVRLLPAAPLMHGTSAITSWGVLCAAGSIVTLHNQHFSAIEVLRAIETHGVTNLTIVGDVFAKPLLAAIREEQANGTPPNLSSLELVISSGVMWSQPVKDALIEVADVVCADLLGSSEGTGFARSVSSAGRGLRTASFRLGPHAAVFGEDGQRVLPGSGTRGLLAVGGPIPIGYYNDPIKTAETFRTFEGKVWSIPGDFATVESDGTITLLGRGSVSINTGGEKVYPEEVEEVLKLHPDVGDANVVGIADERWGSRVVGVVEASESRQPSDGELHEHCRQHLAGYKIPKTYVWVDQLQRGPNGKADYRWAATVAGAAASLSDPDQRE